MFVDSNFYHNDNGIRFGLAFGAALLAHGLILAWFSYAPTSKIIDANLASPPTNITISFTSPKKVTPTPKEVIAPAPIEKAKPKPIAKRIAAVKPIETPAEQLNKIEPAAAQMHAQQPATKEPVIKQAPAPTKPTPKAIPIVSNTKLKGRRVQPKYPDRALRMKQEGVVWLRVLISETGARQDIKIHKPTKYALLNQAAMKAVKKWTFEPNVVNGRATKSWVEIPVEFKIQ